MVCFSLGSNLGNRIEFLRQAMQMLEERVGKMLSISSIYETEPWGVDGHQNYYNLVAWFDTKLLPDEVLETAMIIEKELGRMRIKNMIEPRTIDIDILFYNNLIIDTKSLKIPHPLIKNRNFVLVPLAEVSGEFVHPEQMVTINELVKSCQDTSIIIKTDIKIK